MYPNLYAKLEGTKVVVATHSSEIDHSNLTKRIAFDGVGNFTVTTTFLGRNHGCEILKKNLWFQVMVKNYYHSMFGLQEDDTTRYAEYFETYEQAVERHKEIVEQIKQNASIVNTNNN